MRCMCGDSFADGGTTTSDHRCAMCLDYEAPPARGDGGLLRSPSSPKSHTVFRYRKVPEKSAELFKSHRLVMCQNVRCCQAWRCSQVVKEIAVILVFL